MAHVTSKIAHETQAAHWPPLWSKAAVAMVFIVAVRVLFGQQTAPTAGVPEEVDGQNYKYQIPLEKYRKSRNDEQKMRSQVRGVLNGNGSISDPAARLLFREFYLAYLY